MFLLLGLMVLMIAVLSGCSPSATTVTHTTEDLKNGGFWQSNVVYYFAIALDTFAKWFNGQYGLAVLVMVIIVRTLILPLTIKQVKSSRAMQAIQPELEKIKKNIKMSLKRYSRKRCACSRRIRSIQWRAVCR